MASIDTAMMRVVFMQVSSVGVLIMSYNRDMKFPADFPITRKWPPRHPDRIQLYAINSPNGVKASVMLEETGLPYEPHLVRFDQKDQLSPEFRSLNPYAKIPAIIDPLGPNGAPLALFESAAILIYLADKSGKFLAPDGAARYETLQWLMFQTANISPIFGQVGFFHKFEGKRTRTSDRAIAMWRSRAACSTSWKSGSRTARGSWERTSRSPTSGPFR